MSIFRLSVVISILLSALLAQPQPATLHPFLAGSHWGFIDKRGTVKIKPEFDSANRFSDGLAAVKKDGRWGYVNLEGRIVIDYHFLAEPGFFSEGRAASRAADQKNDQLGFLDRKGEFVVEPQFDRALYYSKGLVAVLKNGKWRYLDLSGRVVIPAEFEDAASFHEGLARVRIGNKVGFIDHLGGMVIESNFDAAGNFSGGLAPVAKRDGDLKWGYIDRQGKLSVPLQFDSAGEFSEGLAPVQKGFLWGFVDSTGDFVIPARYLYAQHFSYGVAAVQLRETRRYGYVDHYGVLRISAQFSSTWDFSGDGVARVGIPEKVSRGPTASGAHGSPWWGYIDSSGRLFWSYGPPMKAQ